MSATADTSFAPKWVDEKHTLAYLSQESAKIEAQLHARLQVVEQSLAETTRKIQDAEHKNTGLRATITGSTSVAAASITFIALTALAAPVGLVAFGTASAGFTAYQYTKYLTGK